MRDTLGRDVVTERRACRVLGQARNTQRRKASVADDEPRLVKRIVWMASEYGRYGYRRITALLRAEGWWVNHKRVERIWRQEGLKVPARQPKRRRLWLGDGSCIRLRPTHRNHVWSYDFVMDRTADGRSFRMLTIVDEYTRTVPQLSHECWYRNREGVSCTSPASPRSAPRPARRCRAMSTCFCRGTSRWGRESPQDRVFGAKPAPFGGFRRFP